MYNHFDKNTSCIQNDNFKHLSHTHDLYIIFKYIASTTGDEENIITQLCQSDHMETSHLQQILQVELSVHQTMLNQNPSHQLNQLHPPPLKTDKGTCQLNKCLLIASAFYFFMSIQVYLPIVNIFKSFQVGLNRYLQHPILVNHE